MKKNEKGFTLIELLVVVAIIGILAAIAIPQFAAYKIRAFNARAESDLRNGITAEEAYFVDAEEYATCANGAACAAALPGFRASSGVDTFSFTAAADGQSYTGVSEHSGGDLNYTYDSATGVIAGA